MITRSSIVYFFLCISVFNQLCLISLVAQIIYVLLNEAHVIGNSTINLILCKTIPYAVKTLTYCSKWSIAYVSITRLQKTTVTESISTSVYLSSADKKQVRLLWSPILDVKGMTKRIKLAIYTILFSYRLAVDLEKIVCKCLLV